MKIWRVILATLVIFGTGVVTGGLMVANVYQRTPAPAPQAQRPPNHPPIPFHEMQRAEFVHRLDKQLELNRAQRENVTAIMADSNQRTKALWEPLAPTMREEVKRVREKIRETLTPDQRKKFDKENAAKNRPNRKENKMDGEFQSPTGEPRNSPRPKKPLPANRQTNSVPSVEQAD